MDNVKTLEDLIKRIDNARDYMCNLIKKKSNLLDPEIMAASKMLDSILNEYNKIVSDKIDN